MNRPRTVLCVLLFSFAGAAAPSRAAAAGRNDYRVRWGADAEAYLTAPLHLGPKQWAKFGSMIGAVALAYQYDNKVRSHFVPVGSKIHRAHNAEDALPGLLTLGGTWIAARSRNDPDGRREVGTMLEAALFGTTEAQLLTIISGRDQPNQGPRNDFHDRTGDALPSGHVTMAFAIGTVLAESGNRRRWLRRVFGYGIGALTAYQRMKHNCHWFSDTVAGAGVGIGTARFLLKRHDQANDRSDLRAFVIVPTRDGVMLSYTRRLRD